MPLKFGIATSSRTTVWIESDLQNSGQRIRLALVSNTSIQEVPDSWQSQLMPLCWVAVFRAIFIAAIMTNGILIADDSGTFRTAVRAYLTRQNFEVCGEAIDGTDALEKATHLHPP